MHDPLWGSIVLAHDSGTAARMTIAGESIPTSSIQRIGGAATRTDVPIGTRNPARLRLLIDDHDFDMHPAPGGFSRRSHRVTVTGRGHTWLFAAATPTAHRLVRGSRYTGGNEIGMFTEFEHAVTAEWTHDIRFAGIVADQEDSTPLDCSLGYLLAAAFGTGAQLMLFALFGNAVESIFPPGG